MGFFCSPDPAFGQSATLWSEMPTPLWKASGAVEDHPAFVGGYVNAVWDMGGVGRTALLVTSWDPKLPARLNWRVLRLVMFPSNGQPAALGRGDGTRHLFLSEFTLDCQYLDSAPASGALLVLLREHSGYPGPWNYVLRQLVVDNPVLGSVHTGDVAVNSSWLYEPATAPPMGNVKLAADGTNPGHIAIVSTHGESLRVTLLTLGQSVTAKTTDFASIISGGPDPFSRLRVESVRFYGGSLSIALTAWRLSARSQGFIFRLTVTGTAVVCDTGYGTNGLWVSSLADFTDFRAVRECSGALVGTATSKLVVFGVRPDGQDLDPGFGAGGICELDLGGTLLDEPVAVQDRNGWMVLFAQRQNDLATVGARVRVNTPLFPVPHGSIDPGFGTNGIVTLRADGYATSPSGLSLDWGTKLYVGLTRGSITGTRIPGVARLRYADGALDNSFGSAAVARHPGMSRAVAFGADGTCISAVSRVSDNTLTLIWLDAQGRFVKAATHSHAVASNQASSVLLHSDGTIWVSGGGGRAWVARFTAAGVLDQGFGTAGFVKLRETDPQDGFAFLIGPTPLANGDVIVRVITIQGSFLCTLSLSTGNLDASYGQSGYVQLPSFLGSGSGHTTRPDGHAVYAVTTGHDPNKVLSLYMNMGLVLITPTGTVDATFGVGNLGPVGAPAGRKLALPLPFPGSTIEVMESRIVTVLEHGGKLLAVGTADAGRGRPGGQFSFPVYRFLFITRWNLDGSLDTLFGRGGAEVYGYASVTDYLDWECTAAIPEPGGGVILAGHAAGQPAIWRLTSSGALDTSFGAGGACSVRLQEVTEDTAYAVIVLPAGKVRLACATGLIQFALTTGRVFEGTLAPLIEKIARHLVRIKRWILGPRG
jgi:uncharacterized delta-60 repeat protein